MLSKFSVGRFYFPTQITNCSSFFNALRSSSLTVSPQSLQHVLYRVASLCPIFTTSLKLRPFALKTPLRRFSSPLPSKMYQSHQADAASYLDEHDCREPALTADGRSPSSSLVI